MVVSREEASQGRGRAWDANSARSDDDTTVDGDDIDADLFVCEVRFETHICRLPGDTRDDRCISVLHRYKPSAMR